MNAALRLVPTLEMGSLRVVASVQDPDVWHDTEAPEVAHIDEGAVALSLEFPNRDAVGRFQVRVAAMCVAPEPPS